MLAPAFGINDGGDGLAVCRGTREAQRSQRRGTLGYARRSLGPVPDKQVDAGGLFGAQDLACHQTGHRATSIEATGPGLHVIGQAPIQFALHDQVPGLR
ncbi:hypothetical protein D3C71_1532920 [compost metagenome]